MNPFVDSSDIREDGKAICQRADRDGYVFIRDFVDKEAIFQRAGHSQGLAGSGMD